MRFAEVAVDAPAGHNRTFSYSIPSSMSLSPGQAVRVPFGPRLLQGIVFELTPLPQVSDTRDVEGILEGQPPLSATQLQLARWMSDHYMAPLFECAAALLPPGARTRARAYLSLIEETPPEVGRLTPPQTQVVRYLGQKGKVWEETLLKALGTPAKAAVAGLTNRNLIARTWEWDKPRVAAKYEACLRLAATLYKVEEAEQALSLRAPRQAALLRRLAEADSALPLPDLRREFGGAVVKALQEKGLVAVEMARVTRDPLAGKVFAGGPVPRLTSAQQRAATEVAASFIGATSGPKVFLLQGVTGSGKTEVYLDAVRGCLDVGKRAIVLVPEISLTSQTIQRFGARFPGRVAVLHSRLPLGEQFDQWWGIFHGDYDVVVGSRSAIFAPQPDLGLIVIDEEHEWTYKQQDQSPRYHARDVALKLAELTGATVVMGSATPDVATYHKAKTGAYRLLELPERIHVSSPVDGRQEAVEAPSKGGLATVEIVDMRRELTEGNRSILSRSLHKALASTLDAGKQAILFLNRRGSASFVQCRVCGLSLRCRRCDVPFTYHGVEGYLICHHCNQRRRLPELCPQCRRGRLRYFGAGTQTVAEEVARLFPGISLLRWDRDTARTPLAHEQLLEGFQGGEAQVMVGTQMIAKGLDIPGVTLVGAVSADMGLNIPDFRSGERAFQVLCQVAGRAGRGPSEGKAIIQTFQPDHYAVVAAAAQDYAAFHAKEVDLRREYGNPPFSRLVRLLYRHTNSALCGREAQGFAGRLRQERDAWGLSDVEVIGPAPAFPPRVRGLYRWHLVLRGRDPTYLLGKLPVPPGWEVDVDPVSLT